jgi:hypothetical protein
LHSVPDIWPKIVKEERKNHPKAKIIGLTVWEVFMTSGNSQNFSEQQNSSSMERTLQTRGLFDNTMLLEH